MRTPALGLAALAAASAGCEMFQNPPVKCTEPPYTFSLDMTTTPGRTGYCVFPDPLPFTVAHTPRIDSARYSESSSPGDRPRNSASDLTLAGSKVTVAQATGAVLLCAGVSDVGCQQGAPQITVVVANDGSLAYQGTWSLRMLGADLPAGGNFTYSGPLVTETYGPGNTCRVLTDVKLGCQKTQ